jgi:hypothetical protein
MSLPVAPFEQEGGIVDFVPELRARYPAVRMWLSIPSGKVLSLSPRGHFYEYHTMSAGTTIVNIELNAIELIEAMLE